MLKKLKIRIFVKSLISNLLMGRTLDGQDLDFRYPTNNKNYFDLDTVIDKLTEYILSDYEYLVKDLNNYECLDDDEKELNQDVDNWFVEITKYLPIVESMHLDCKESFFTCIKDFCKEL
uniref:Uncharacterized protein n=1 Tax=viral metagenome TaxID=1070528 RepID=A0A6C0AC32_9ZZZZ